MSVGTAMAGVREKLTNLFQRVNTLEKRVMELEAGPQPKMNPFQKGYQDARDAKAALELAKMKERHAELKLEMGRAPNDRPEHWGFQPEEIGPRTEKRIEVLESDEKLLVSRCRALEDEIRKAYEKNRELTSRIEMQVEDKIAMYQKAAEVERSLKQQIAQIERQVEIKSGRVAERI